MKSTRSFFLYGSWFPGFVHHKWLEQFIDDAQAAYIKGSVYRSNVGYPILINEGTDRIPGVLAQITGPSALFLLMDEFHGISAMNPEASVFQRFEAQVFIGDEVTQAQAYAMPKMRVSPRWPRIVGGDWVNQLKNQPDLVSTLSDSQKIYLSRLGASKGKEGVPSDLTVYRELLKLDLIVDRGRRVGLSKLGKEVVKYLPQFSERVH